MARLYKKIAEIKLSVSEININERLGVFVTKICHRTSHCHRIIRKCILSSDAKSYIWGGGGEGRHEEMRDNNESVAL